MGTWRAKIYNLNIYIVFGLIFWTFCPKSYHQLNLVKSRQLLSSTLWQIRFSTESPTERRLCVKRMFRSRGRPSRQAAFLIEFSDTKRMNFGTWNFPDSIFVAMHLMWEISSRRFAILSLLSVQCVRVQFAASLGVDKGIHIAAFRSRDSGVTPWQGRERIILAFISDDQTCAWECSTCDAALF